MKAYILMTEAVLSPFGDPVRDSRILDRPLVEHQESIFSDAGLDVHRVGSVDEIDGAEDCFVTLDTLYFSRQLFTLFRKRARAEGRSSAIALFDCAFTKSTSTLQDVCRETHEGETILVYGLYFLKAGDRPAELRSVEGRTPLRIRERVQRHPRVDKYSRGEEQLEFAFTPFNISDIAHWSHLLYANFYALLSHWADLRPWSILRYLFVVVRTILSLTFLHSVVRALLTFDSARLSDLLYLLMKNANRIGRGCRIHPTATVEGSILGHGVKIGPQATVFGSYLGDGAVVEMNAIVRNSVMGAGTTITANTRINFCVLYPDAMSGQSLLQVSILGERAVLMTSGFTYDMKITKPIKVDFRGERVSLGTKYIGCCFGHESIIGAGIWLNAGLEIPNGYMIVREGERIIRQVPTGLPPKVPLVPVDGVVQVHPSLKESGEDGD